MSLCYYIFEGDYFSFFTFCHEILYQFIEIYSVRGAGLLGMNVGSVDELRSHELD